MQKRREVYIDYARAIAIIGATVVHIFSKFDVWSFIDSYDTLIRIPLRILSTFPTPTLLIIFGMMVEIVYVKMSQVHGYRELIRRVLNRVFLIYIAYTFAALVDWIHNPIDYIHLLKQMLFLERAPFSSILIMYTFALLALPLVVYIRIRFGLITLFTISLVVFAIQRYIPYDIIPESLRFLTSTVVGVGDGNGPSTINSLILITFGITIANVTVVNKRYTLHQLYVIYVPIVASTLVLLTKEHSFNYFITQYIDIRYRVRNDIEYFLASSVLATSTLLLIRYLTMLKFPNTLQKYSARILNSPLKFIGSNALLVYTVGTVMLGFIPNNVIHLSNIPDIFVYTSTFLLSLYIISYSITTIYSRVRYGVWMTQ